MKMCPMGAEFFHACQQTIDVTKLIVSFCSLEKVPNEQKTARRISTETEQVRHPTLYITFHKFMYI